MAMRLLAQPKFQDDAQLLHACNAIDRAVAGYQTPASAIHGFAEFARTRGMLATTPKSKARESFERMLGFPRRVA